MTANAMHTARPVRSRRRRNQRSSDVDSASESFAVADRLNRLFQTVHPPGRGPYTNIEVVTMLADQGLELSAAYLSQLRSGKRTRPSRATARVLATFFGIDPHYFLDDDSPYVRHLDAELNWRRVAQDPFVRDITTAILGLPRHRRAELFGDQLD